MSTPGIHGGVNDGPAGELSPWVRLIAQECDPRAVRCGACQAHTDRRFQGMKGTRALTENDRVNPEPDLVHEVLYGEVMR
jgi:hypothetical protein